MNKIEQWLLRATKVDVFVHFKPVIPDIHQKALNTISERLFVVRTPAEIQSSYS